MIVRALLAVGFAVGFMSTPAAWSHSICGVKYKSPSQVEKVLRNKGLSLNNSDSLYVADMERPSPAMFLALACKGRHRAALNMGDCFAYACAKMNRVPLLCKGDDFVHTDIRIA